MLAAPSQGRRLLPTGRREDFAGGDAQVPGVPVAGVSVLTAGEPLDLPDAEMPSPGRLDGGRPGHYRQHRMMRAMYARGDLRRSADPNALALALLTALEGGLLMTQIRRDPAPLRAVLDVVLAQIEGLTPRRSRTSQYPRNRPLTGTGVACGSAPAVLRCGVNQCPLLAPLSPDAATRVPRVSSR
jgi:hypothetical protein